MADGEQFRSARVVITQTDAIDVKQIGKFINDCGFDVLRVTGRVDARDGLIDRATEGLLTLQMTIAMDPEEFARQICHLGHEPEVATLSSNTAIRFKEDFQDIRPVVEVGSF